MNTLVDSLSSLTWLCFHTSDYHTEHATFWICSLAPTNVFFAAAALPTEKTQESTPSARCDLTYAALTALLCPLQLCQEISLAPFVERIAQALQSCRIISSPTGIFQSPKFRMVQGLGETGSPGKKRQKEKEDGKEAGQAPGPAAGADGGEGEGGDKKKAGKSKGKGGGGAAPNFSNKELSKMVVDLSRLVLSHDDSIGHLEAFQIITYILPSESKSMEAGKAEGAQYYKKAAQADKETQNKLGPPHVYIAIATAKSLLDTVKVETSTRSNDLQQQLKEFIQELQHAEMEDAIRIVPYFRLNKTFKEEWRVRFRCQQPVHEGCLSWFFQQEGGVERVGKAPRGRLARQCQQHLTV